MFIKSIVVFGLLACALGAPSAEDDGRIVGGKDAAPGQFPYMASLRSDNRHFCGGSIISKKTVLTAAHCEVGQIIQMTVVVGTNNLAGGGVSHRVSKFIKHKDWNTSTLENDVAVVIVVIEITFTDLVRPIALPDYNIGDDVAVTASGWGLTSYPGQDPPNKLQYLVTRTISFAKCRSMHGGDLFNSQICVLTKKGQGVCSGDSGGPIVAREMIQGIASAAYLCATGLPDFFTRVNSFNPWIKQNMVN